MGPVSSALMRSASAATGDKPSPPAKGAFSPGSEKDKWKELALCKSQQQASLTHLVEEFFWIGSSIVAFSKWRLGFMGELRALAEASRAWLLRDAREGGHMQNLIF